MKGYFTVLCLCLCLLIFYFCIVRYFIIKNEFVPGLNLILSLFHCYGSLYFEKSINEVYCGDI